MRNLITSLLFLGFAQFSFAQPGIRGKVADTLENRFLENAVVALIQKSDSTLYKFVRTDRNGAFNISVTDQGKYFILITYPKFVDFIDEVEIKDQPLDLGTFSLIQQAKLLEDLIVRQNVAIRMKGDTIEYKADSFKVAEGSTVKDLLRKLPGMQIDKNGQVIAQGQKVEKVLVDGEEFFSDDPAVVIENLRADAIDKVQSYDKKSDQAEFTGVDDGSRSKTLNLVLKDDRKKGYLGKIVVGGGTSERYSEEAMLNYFKGKKKFSVYGIASNTGRLGLDWNDRSKFGAGNDFGDAEVEMGAGFIMITGDGDDDFGDWQSNYYDEGIPRTIRAGAHASNKWSEDKQNANANYSLKNMLVNAEGNSLRKFILPDSAYYSRENHKSNTRQNEHLFNGTYDLKLDSSSSLKFKFNGRIENKSTGTETNTSSEDENLGLVNRNYRTNSTGQDNKIFLGSVLWRQKLKKKRRTISLSASYKNSEKKSDGYLFSATDFFENGMITEQDTIDQYKRNSSLVTTANSKLVYTEPIGKKSLLEFNYTFSKTSSTSDRKSFDKANGKYEQLNDLFSNRYSLNYLSNSGGLKYQYTGKKLTANIGSNMGVADYRQNDSSGKEVRHYRYTNLFPTSRFTYRFSQQRHLNLQYSGTPQPPSVEEIQPTRENTNPLFIVIGNPLLEQAFRHNISLFFTDFKMLSGRSIWLQGSFSPVQNAIVSNQVIDRGITTQKYVNTSGNYNYYFYGSYGTEIKSIGLNVGLNTNVNGGRYVNFVNGIKNSSRQTTLGLGFNSSKYKEEKYDVSVSTDFNYNRSASNINIQDNNFWSQQHNIRLHIYFTKKFQFGTEANFYLREKTDAFTGNNNFTVWDADLSYKFFKKRNGVLKLEVKDILKQRRGFDRQINANYIFERNYNMLGRYAMLSFQWNFTKNPGETK
jgi:hypothetical protein